MKLSKALAIATAIILGTSLAQAAGAKLVVKAGDTAYVCQCPSSCGCGTAALKPAKASCGHDLGKVTVTKVKGNKAYYQAADGREHAFKLTGKYGCGCGGNCCMMVSAKPGKCCCGKELVKGGKI